MVLPHPSYIPSRWAGGLWGPRFLSCPLPPSPTCLSTPHLCVCVHQGGRLIGVLKTGPGGAPRCALWERQQRVHLPE